MEYVPLDENGKIPEGRVPFPGGCEYDRINKLYFASGKVPKAGCSFATMFWGETIEVPGKWGEHLGGVLVPYGEDEVTATDGAVLCWKK